MLPDATTNPGHKKWRSASIHRCSPKSGVRAPILSQYGLKTYWVEKRVLEYLRRPLKSINDAAYGRFLERLRAARMQAKISQEQLAERLDRHQTYVSKIESGARLLDLMEYLRWAREIDANPMTLLEPLANEVQSRKRPRKRTMLNPEVK